MADKGIIAAKTTPQLDTALERVNQARKTSNRQALAPRSLQNLTDMVKRHAYGASEARLGISEWRALGRSLRQLREDHPTATINDRLLKPKNAIPLDFLPDEGRKGQQSGENGPKIRPVLEGDEIVLVDRFDGALISQIYDTQEVDEAGGEDVDEAGGDEVKETDGDDIGEFPDDVRRSSSKRKRASDTAEESDEDSRDSGDGERSPKRQR
jgi:hypothetical protein